jgi:hypothetical protein
MASALNTLYYDLMAREAVKMAAAVVICNRGMQKDAQFYSALNLPADNPSVENKVPDPGDIGALEMAGMDEDTAKKVVRTAIRKQKSLTKAKKRAKLLKWTGIGLAGLVLARLGAGFYLDKRNLAERAYTKDTLKTGLPALGLALPAVLGIYLLSRGGSGLSSLTDSLVNATDTKQSLLAGQSLRGRNAERHESASRDRLTTRNNSPAGANTRWTPPSFGVNGSSINLNDPTFRINIPD